MSIAYIVKNGKAISCVNTELKNGEIVHYSFERVEEAIDANREYNLVNWQIAVISRAKKYEKTGVYCMAVATEINPREFYIESLLEDEDEEEKYLSSYDEE